MRDLIWDPDEQPEPPGDTDGSYTLDAIAELQRQLRASTWRGTNLQGVILDELRDEPNPLVRLQRQVDSVTDAFLTRWPNPYLPPLPAALWAVVKEDE